MNKVSAKIQKNEDDEIKLVDTKTGKVYKTNFLNAFRDFERLLKTVPNLSLIIPADKNEEQR